MEYNNTDSLPTAGCFLLQKFTIRFKIDNHIIIEVIMKFIKQLSVIILVCFAGELIRYIIPLPVPGSIWGLVLMFILLVTGVVKLEKVETAADFLVDCMPIMFVPGGVGLMRSWSTLKSMLPAAVCSVVLVTPFVMLITGKVTQTIIEKGDK